MHPTKPAQKPSITRATFSRIALALTLICTQISFNGASAKSAPAKKTTQQAIIFFEQGIKAFDRSDFQQAIRDYTTSISIDNSSASPYYNRGNSYQELNDHSSAIRDYTKAISIDPHKAEAYYNRGISYQSIGDTSSAIRDYSEAIAVDPNKSEAYNNRGLIFLRSGDYRKATRDARKACSLGNCEGVHFLRENGWLRD